MPRRTRLLSLAAAALLLLAVTAEAQDWRGRGRIEGQVTTESGDPIEGVKVTISPASSPDEGPEPFYTKKNGRWSYLGIIGGTWKILLEKEGYITSEGSSGISEVGRTPPVVVQMKANPFAGIGRGDELLAEKKYAEAREEYRSALTGLEAEQQVRLMARIGDTYFEEGNLAEARSTYEEVLPRLEPAERASVLLKIADIYQKGGDPKAARDAYEKALPALGPADQARILMFVAQAYDQEGDRKSAIESLQRAVELDPQNVATIQLVADLLGREGRDEEAKAYLDRLPEGTKLPSDMVLNQGIRLYNEGDTEAALPLFERAVAENPKVPVGYYYRGLVYLSQERNDEAKADFLKLLELAPDHEKAGEVKEFLSFLE